MRYRVLWTTFALLGINVAALELGLPCRYAYPLAVIAVVWGWWAAAVLFRGFSKGLKQYERERDEFNRKLRERG